jgi:hypothetical protein
MQYAICNMQYATPNIQHPTSNIQQTSNIQHATRTAPNTKHARTTHRITHAHHARASLCIRYFIVGVNNLE